MRKINRRVKRVRIVSIDDCKRYVIPIHDDGYYMRDNSFRIINIDGKPFFVRQEVARCVGYWYFDATVRSMNRYWEDVAPDNDDYFVKFSEHAPKSCELAVDSADITIAAIKYMMDSNYRYNVHQPYQDFLDFVQNVALPDFYSNHQALKVFIDNSELFCKESIRAVVIDGEAWFVAKDICDALGYANSRDALAKHVDERDKQTVNLNTVTNRDGISDCNTVANRDGIRGNPNVTFINMSGVFRLIFTSQMPKAREFTHWVTSEVLPTLYRTGTYSIVKTSPDDGNLLTIGGGDNDE